MALTGLLLTERAVRDPPEMPFGWGVGGVVLLGAGLAIVGVLLLLWGMFSLLAGTVGNATSGSFDIGSFFGGFFGALALFAIGGVLAGVGGWLLRLSWLYLLVDTVADARASRRGARHWPVQVRCLRCGALNPEAARFCNACAGALGTAPPR
jgi:hypothetical protein